MFGCGTAAVVSPVKLFAYDGVDYDVPINESLNAGEFTAKMAKKLNDVHTGRWNFKDWSIQI